MHRGRNAIGSSSPSISTESVSESLQQILDVSVFWEYRTVLLRGLAVNFYVFACAAALALSLGLGAALLRIRQS